MTLLLEKDAPVVCQSEATVLAGIQFQRSALSKLSSGLPLSEKPELGNMVNFSRADAFPVQRWFRYREGFAANLAQAFLSDNWRGAVALDPFCGCGTTLFAAQQQNIPSLGIEINPIFSLVSKVKIRGYGKLDISEIAKIARELSAARADGRLRNTAFPLAGKVFNAEVLQALLQLREIVIGAKRQFARDALLVAWLSVIESVSNIRKEGNGIKYRFVKRTPNGYRPEPQSKWEAKNIPVDRFDFVKRRLGQKITEMLEDLKCRNESESAVARVINGDCLAKIQEWKGMIGAAIFSPPYCNCFDYFEIHKTELWLGGFVNSHGEMRRLRRGGFCSNLNADLNRPAACRFGEVERIATELEKRPLWSKRIPQVIRGYFSDTARLFSLLRTKMRKGGKIAVVVGNSAYSGVVIPTDLLVAHIAKQEGFDTERIWICRRLTTSSQQQKILRPLHEYLRESMLIFRRNG
jgi:DNA modification methylase